MRTKIENFIIVLILWSALLLVDLAYGQQSSYNSGKKLSPISTTNEFNATWLTYDKSEMFTCESNVVGYAKAYREIQIVLSHYKLEFESPSLNENINVKDLSDFSDMNMDLFLENCEVLMVWRTDECDIFFQAKKGINAVTIIPRK